MGLSFQQFRFRLFGYLNFISVSVVLIAVLLLSLSCSTRTDRGTEDSGGGDVEWSTAAEVKSSVLRMQKYLMDHEAYSKMSKDFGQQKNSNSSIALGAREIFVNAGVMGASVGATKQGKSCSTFLELLPKLKVRFEENDFCPAINNNHADASVSDYSFNAEVCFSLKSLKRVPKASLDKTIYGLWWHELSHLLGNRDEAKANFIEDWAQSSFHSEASILRLEKSRETYVIFYGVASFFKEYVNEIYASNFVVSNKLREVLLEKLYSSRAQALVLLARFVQLDPKKESLEIQSLGEERLYVRNEIYKLLEEYTATLDILIDVASIAKGSSDTLFLSETSDHYKVADRLLMEVQKKLKEYMPNVPSVSEKAAVELYLKVIAEQSLNSSSSPLGSIEELIGPGKAFEKTKPFIDNVKLLFYLNLEQVDRVRKSHSQCLLPAIKRWIPFQ